jgi:protease-4
VITWEWSKENHLGLMGRGAALAAYPVGALVRVVHRMMTGKDVILDVTIDRVPELHVRDQLIRRLKRTAKDPLVGGVLLRLRNSPAGWASCQDLRDAITEIRAAGTPVYAWLETAGNAVTWLAAACDRVFLVPPSELGLVGVGVELTFFGSALARLGIQPDFEAAGTYKSFGEPWTRSFPSPANQEAVRELVDDLHAQLVAGIAAGRGKSEAEIHAALARAPLSAEDALAAGLVDELLYEDQLETWLKEHHGKGTKLVPFSRWAVRDALQQRVSRWGQSGTVVSVLHLQGPIVLEERPNGSSIGARKVIPILKKLREDEEVGAVVLHVDSPGGSALASDLIWREVAELKRSKPVVASFEDVSASGGFYLSAPANAIFVRPATLTGSIGVFGGKLVMQEGLRKVGVHTQEILGAPNANLFSATRHFSPDQRDRFRASLQRFYDGFVRRVAEGRGQIPNVVEPHCRGRVWTGRVAQGHGLVDASGGQDAAIERATNIAGLSSSKVVRRDLTAHHEPLFQRLFSGVLRQVMPSAVMRMASWAERWVVGPGGWMVDVATQHPGEPLAMLPFDAEIK